MSEVTTAHKWLQLTDQEVVVYNYWDCLATARAKRTLVPMLGRNSQLTYWHEEVWSMLPAVMNMQRRGLPYDTKLKGIYRKKLRRELAQCDARLRTLYAENR